MIVHSWVIFTNLEHLGCTLGSIEYKSHRCGHPPPQLPPWTFAAVTRGRTGSGLTPASLRRRRHIRPRRGASVTSSGRCRSAPGREEARSASGVARSATPTPGCRLPRRGPPLPSSPGVPVCWLPRGGERGPRHRSPCGWPALPTSRSGGGKAKGWRREGATEENEAPSVSPLGRKRRGRERALWGVKSTSIVS